VPNQLTGKKRMSDFLNKQELLSWLSSKESELLADRDRSSNNDNWDKAASKDAERLAFQRIINRIDLGDFDSSVVNKNI